MTALMIPDDVAETYVGLQYRSATVESLDEEERIIRMRAVPYDVETRLAENLVEVFDKATFAKATQDPARVKLFYGHSTEGGKVVGQAVTVEDRADGVWLETRVSRTDSGEELLTLAKDGVLDEASIEFAPMRDFMVVRRRGSDVVVRHRRGHLRGVAIVPAGAYGRHAIVTAVRDMSAKLAEEKVARLRLLNH